MQVTVQQGSIQETIADLIIVNLFEGVVQPGGGAVAVDKALGGRIGELIALGDAGGRLGQTALLHTFGALPSPRVLVVGLGDRSGFDLAAVRTAAARALSAAAQTGARRIATLVHGAGAGGLSPVDAAQAVVEASLLEAYVMPREASGGGVRPGVEELVLVEFSPADLPAVRNGATTGRIVAESVLFARDLVATPSNIATPAYLAEAARSMAAASGLTCTVLEREDMEALGMGILLAVAKGSDEPPMFVILEHNRERATGLETVVLVGKGVTFDTGGYSLKVESAATMWKMKGDMTGAADVMAALRAAALLDLPLHVVGLAPLCENMINGRAQKPGDVYRGMTGKTMEVISTDAEGRMVLADALAYAGRYQGAKAVVDLATLTATIGLALGPKAAGLFTPDDILRERLLAAAAVSGERLWPMPMYDDYAHDIASDFADVKNSTLPDKATGVSTSAKFLQHFTEGYPWAHIDLANMSWAATGRPLYPKGATAFGVRLLIQFLRDWAG